MKLEEIEKWILYPLIAFGGFFGKATYEKIDNIEKNVTILMVSNGESKKDIDNNKSEIKEIKDWMNSGRRKPSFSSIRCFDAILPDEEENDKKQLKYK